MYNKISTPSKTREIIESNKFSFKKSFGQNFLIDSNIINKIVSVADIDFGDCVLEIGPGIGTLTQYLAEKANKVIAIEIDKNLIPILNQTLASYNNIEVINSDILKIDIHELVAIKNNGMPIKVVANLPYYITTPIIMSLLENKVPIKTITVMVQKEVAQRMQASAGTKDYGSLSIATQYYCDTSIDIIVPPSCFIPKPNVSSAVITLKVLDTPKVIVKDEELFFRLIKNSFGQRRKTLVNCIYNLGQFGLSKTELENILKSLDLDEKTRGESLTIYDFSKLSDAIYDILNI